MALYLTEPWDSYSATNSHEHFMKIRRAVSYHWLLSWEIVMSHCYGLFTIMCLCRSHMAILIVLLPLRFTINLSGLFSTISCGIIGQNIVSFARHKLHLWIKVGLRLLFIDANLSHATKQPISRWFCGSLLDKSYMCSVIMRRYRKWYFVYGGTLYSVLGSGAHYASWLFRDNTYVTVLIISQIALPRAIW